MPERRFKVIKLKKTPAGSARTFPSEISTVEAAIAFVSSLDSETRAKLHWRVAASVLNGLDAGKGTFDQAAFSHDQGVIICDRRGWSPPGLVA
jgi:hypothetical protein